MRFVDFLKRTSMSLDFLKIHILSYPDYVYIPLLLIIDS